VSPHKKAGNEGAMGGVGFCVRNELFASVDPILKGGQILCDPAINDADDGKLPRVSANLTQRVRQGARIKAHVSECPKNGEAVDAPHHHRVCQHGHIVAGSASNKIRVLVAEIAQTLVWYLQTGQQVLEGAHLSVLIVFVAKVEQMDFEQAAVTFRWRRIE
jgi:hypothetical protein